MNSCTVEHGILWGCIIASLLVACGVSSFSQQQRKFEENPQNGKIFYISLAVLQMLLATVLLAASFGTSDCFGSKSFVIYGIAAAGIGLVWFYKAWRLGNPTANAAAGDNDADGCTEAPSVEFSITEESTMDAV